jgi:hypothetical protein
MPAILARSGEFDESLWTETVGERPCGDKNLGQRIARRIQALALGRSEQRSFGDVSRHSSCIAEGVAAGSRLTGGADRNKLPQRIKLCALGGEGDLNPLRGRRLASESAASERPSRNRDCRYVRPTFLAMV